MNKGQVSMEALAASVVLGLILVLSVGVYVNNMLVLEEKTGAGENERVCIEIANGLSNAFNSFNEISFPVDSVDKNFLIGEGFVLVNDQNIVITNAGYALCKHTADFNGQGYFRNQIRIEKNGSDLNVIQE